MNNKSNRKPFNDRAGYVASRHNMINNGWVVIYLAKEQGLDDSQGKYVVSCELHNVLTYTSSIPKARPLLKYPDFCEECMKEYQLPYKVRVKWKKGEGFNEVGIYRTEQEALRCKKRLQSWEQPDRQNPTIEILREL